MFEELSKAFAAKSAKKVKVDEQDGEGKKATTKKKAKELKILDPKSAQNLCEYTSRVYHSLSSQFYQKTKLVCFVVFKTRGETRRREEGCALTT